MITFDKMGESKRVRLMTKGIVILGSLALVILTSMAYDEWQGKHSCPRFTTIPICHFLIPFTILVVLSQLVSSDHSKLMFWMGLMIPWTIALGGALLEMNGLEDCPVTVGYPACYLFLAIFSVIILLNRIKKDLQSE